MDENKNNEEIKPAPIEEPEIDELTTEDSPTEEEPKEEVASEEPDIVAQAEAEAPAENKQPFQYGEDPSVFTDATQETPKESKPKSKKPIYCLLAVLLFLTIGASAMYLITAQNSRTKEPEVSINNDIEPIPDLEPIQANKLAMKGNELSDFDLAFLHLENKQDNVIYSPLSIKYALAMLADGANGNSKDQITAVIGDYQPKAYLNSANRSLANAMFIRTDFSEQVKESFKDALASKYNASVILDPFTSPDNANQWVEDKTLGIIKNTFDEATINTDLDYMLVNALAIDMKWKNQIQCAQTKEYINGEWVDHGGVPCIVYNPWYPHTNYSNYISHIFTKEDFSKITFNNQENIPSAEIAATYFKYDIIEANGGEEAVREFIQQKYDEWLAEAQKDPRYPEGYHIDFNLDNYIEELSKNYNKNSISSDFYFLDNDTEKVFAKDLQEYDGSTLQYVGIMPKTSSLNTYINNLTAEKTSSLITNLKDVSNADSFEEGVVTKIYGNIPFFKFSFTMDDFMKNLENLGITDVFSTEDADLSGMLNFDEDATNKPFISVAIHKADIDFSNDGIKAAAVTAFGGMGASDLKYFDYLWDVPVKEIDMTFDKPFLFLIRDKNTGEVWFTGTVYNPGN